MTSHENRPPVGRRALLAGAAAGLGAAAALPAQPASAASVPESASASASGRRHPANWPDPAPYGLADTRPDLWPRDDNSFVLPLELRPRDEERGVVWMRDTYVNCFVVDGRPLYVATGTTRVPGLDTAGPWNDGIFVWTARSLQGPWRLADTTGVRPGAEKGKVWSPEFVGENRPGRTVVAPWQEYWYDEQFGKRGQAWAPELHRFGGKWYLLACMGDHSKKVGSFMLVSEGGVEGPYRLVEGNLDKPFGNSFIGGPAFIEPGAYHHIDGSLHSEGDEAWLVLHNNLYARFRDDMEDIVPTTDLPAFRQSPYSPEPYLEGAYVFKYGGKYFLLHAAWDRTSVNADGTTRQAYDTPAAGRVQYQYDAVVAVSDTFEGPYSQRWTAGVGAGHNNFFEDHRGQLWATFFNNPNFGYWSNASRLAEAAVPGVVRVEWTGPKGNRLYVRRRD
ncbi:family 43 glycosylhydrolase [Streptomyces sp. NPDC057621]|uniref:family 43 glycosylhydrolase n=1 Tax=Streptomyces sp. NPDC057621 TaxID=3346186 RepID=UPI0036C48AF2